MALRVCVAGVSGWTGSAVARAALASEEFELTGAIARRQAGRDAGELLGLPENGVVVTASLGEALARPADVLVDFTSPGSVKGRTLEALSRGARVVIGTSGLTAADYADIGSPNCCSKAATSAAVAGGRTCSKWRPRAARANRGTS
jgi:4-hydroxy-tetrahydrodipicolinate reductase